MVSAFRLMIGRFASLAASWVLFPGAVALAATGARAIVEAENGEWRMAAKNFASTRYSELDQIRADNVKGLKLAWTFSTGVNRGHEAAPIVVGKTMFLTTPFPNQLFALDLERPGAAKWTYEPKPDPMAQGVACCDVVSRGALVAGGK